MSRELETGDRHKQAAASYSNLGQKSQIATFAGALDASSSASKRRLADKSAPPVADTRVRRQEAYLKGL